VTITLRFKGYLTESDREIAKMRRIYFFVLLNTIILPLSAQKTLLDLMRDEAKKAKGDHRI
jgi:hypothetical protein